MRDTGGQALLRLLDRIGFPLGGSAVELGCGPRGNLALLAERVGADGRVVGVERRASAVEQARRRAEHGPPGVVEICHGDARATGLPRRAFDLVTMTMVLFTVPRPEGIVAEAAALVRPGGVVALHEGDIVAHLCDPPHVAWDRLRDAIERYTLGCGVDVHVARRLPRMLREAGLVDVRAEAGVRFQPPGHDRRSGLPDFVARLGDRLVESGVIDRTELAETRAALERHVADPETSIVSPLFVQAWGRALDD